MSQPNRRRTATPLRDQPLPPEGRGSPHTACCQDTLPSSIGDADVLPARKSMRRRLTLATLCFCLTLSADAVASDPAFALRSGERILFFGDSITQAGGYLVDLEVFLLTRFPQCSFTLINHGRSSETISGTSEPDHSPRRPDAHLRFSRDVAAWKPDVVVACFGMNDGNYHPLEPQRFALFQRGILRLIDRVHQETAARLVLLTPPPFDPYRRTASDPHAKDFGYRFPAVDYDRTLEAYSQWLTALPGQLGNCLPPPLVVDVHQSLNDHLKKRRNGEVSFYLSSDAVHPGPTGHWLIAQALLLAWKAPATVAEALIEGSETPRVQAGAVRDLSVQPDGSIQFTWTSPLPFPPAPECDARSLALERLSERLNRYRLTITGLPSPQYQLKARIAGDDSPPFEGRFTRDQLAAGLDLTSHDHFPTVVRAREIRTLVARRRQAIDEDWRNRIAHGQDVLPDPAAETESQRTLDQIRALCQPIGLAIELTPLAAAP